jgi:hypothetical protein
VMSVPRGTRAQPFMSRPADPRLANRFDQMVPQVTNRYFAAIIRQVNSRPDLAHKPAASDPTPEQQDFLCFVDEVPFLVSEVFAFIKFFDETTADRDPTNYYMEREWRTLTNVRFTAADVARVIVADRDYAERLAQDFPEYEGKAYVPPRAR